MLLGIVALSAGLTKTLEHPFDPLEDVAAIELAAGAALFLLSEVLFRRLMGIGAGGVRLVGPAAADDDPGRHRGRGGGRAGPGRGRVRRRLRGRVAVTLTLPPGGAMLGGDAACRRC